MADPDRFNTLVPGFEFLQDLVKNAGAALPAIGQWVAPTLDPDELEKRIGELRTVQFWLEQNVTMLAATIQALEVQRMTLSTLKTMNVQMDDLRDSLKVRVPQSEPVAAKTAPGASAETPGGSTKHAGAVDPMQWWGALTQQFTQLATSAIKDTATDAAKNLAASMMKHSLDAANESAPPGAPAPSAGKTPAKKAPRKRPVR